MTKRLVVGAVLSKLVFASADTLPQPMKSEPLAPTPASINVPPTLSEGGIPILMYHDISAQSARLSVAPESLYAQLAYLHERKFRAITLAEFVAQDFSRLQDNEKPYVLTFDDGLRSQFFLDSTGQPANSSAVGVIERFRKNFAVRVPAYFYVITEKPLFEQPEQELALLDYLRSHDFGIGNHTAKHDNLTDASFSRALHALGRADTTLAYLLGSSWGAPHTAAYPYGALPAVSIRHEVQVALGYAFTLHAFGGLAKILGEDGFDSSALNRYETQSTGNKPGGLAWVLAHFPTAHVRRSHAQIATHLY